MRAVAQIVATAALVLTLPTLAAAQVATRTIGVTFHAGAPDVSYSAADFADANVRRRLVSGLPQTLVVTTLAESAGTPVAATVRSCTVVHDIWQDVYRVDIRTPAGMHAVTLPTLDAVVQTCLVVDHVAVGSDEQWTSMHGAHVTFGALIELNPLTPDTVQRIRSWLARPEGGADRDDAFFGSFVSYFVNRQIGQAERTFAFRSQELTFP